MPHYCHTESRHAFLCGHCWHKTGCEWNLCTGHIFSTRFLCTSVYYRSVATLNSVRSAIYVSGTGGSHYYREFFGKELNDKIDPDVTVAWGAASVLD